MADMNTDTEQSGMESSENTENRAENTENRTENTQNRTENRTENTQNRTENRTENRDTVFIGKKPLMAYVTSALIQLANTPVVHIKARGMSIARAVDVAQIISRKTTDSSGYSIGQIKIGSETLESNDGKTRNVSTIEIEVKRNS